jgi:signal transduction histidine kinase
MSHVTRFRSNRLFEGADFTALENTLTHAQSLSVPAGSLIFDDAGEGDTLYLVGSGCVEISKLGRGGQPEALSTFGPDDFFGEMAVLDHQPRSAAATARTDCELLVLNRRDFDVLLQAAPAALTRNLVRAVNSRLRATNDHFIKEMLLNERLSLLGSMANSIMHDLRNHLSTTRFACEILGRNDGNSAEVAAMAIKGVDDAFAMIQEILDYSRGNNRNEVAPATAADLFAELQTIAEALTSDTGVKSTFTNGSTRTMSLDKRRMLRCLVNLARNAVEAMPDGGSLSISAIDENDEVILTVTDTGHGISQDHIPRMFEPFFTSGKRTGTGLGLSIVQAIVTAHAGRITVESEETVGTSVSIQLPAITIY